MDPTMSESSLTQAAAVQSAVFYDVLMNQPLQLQVAVPAVQMIAASPATSQTPTLCPSPSPLPLPSQGPTLVAVSMVPPKDKKVNKLTSEKSERNFPCELCGARFGNASNLRGHMKIHSGIRPYKCPTCEKAFIQSSNLKAHMRVHTGERPFKCSECEQTFTRSSHLVGHKRTHTGERPYICGICGEAFHTSSHLRNHVRRHTGEKPYVCKHCGEAFAQSLELRVHVRYHTGEKPFKCSDCEKKFVTPRELKQHRKTHGSIHYKCEKCERSFRTLMYLGKHTLRCTGPRPKRPKGRPPKHPPGEGEELRQKKVSKSKYRIPGAPTDRVSRSQTRAMRKALIEEETWVKGSEKDNQIEEVSCDTNVSSNEEVSCDSNVISNKVSSTFPSLDELSDLTKNNRSVLPEMGITLKQEPQSELITDASRSLPEIEAFINPPLKSENMSEKHVSQYPMVQIMIDNLTSVADNIVLPPLSSCTLSELQALSGQQEQFAVMDLSGQQMHEDEQNVDSVNLTVSTLPSQQRHQHTASTVKGDQQLSGFSTHQLPLVDQTQMPSATANGSQQVLNSLHKLPLVSTHQHPVSSSHMSVPNSVVTSSIGTSLSVPNSHIVSESGSSMSMPNSLTASGSLTTLPMATTTHHQAVSNPASYLSPTKHNMSTQQLFANTVPAHQHLPSIGSSLQLQSPAVTAHQNLPLALSHQTSSGSFHQQHLPVMNTNQSMLNMGLQQQPNTVNAKLENTVTAHQNMTMSVAHQHLTTSSSGNHQLMPVVSAHQNQLPTVAVQQLNTINHSQLSSGVSTVHSATCHQQLPNTGTHQQTDSHHQQQLSSGCVRQSIPSSLTAHQGNGGLQQQQHLLALAAHKPTASVPQQHFPIISAHQEIACTSSQPITAAHQANGTAVACENQLQVIPLMSVYKPTSDHHPTEDTSQVVYGGGQTFVVDLSNSTISQQVSLVNQSVTNSTYTK